MRWASAPRAPHGPRARPRPLLAQPGPFSILCSSQAEAAGQKPPAGSSVQLSDGAPTQGTHTRWAWLGALRGPGPRDPSCVHNTIPRDGSGGGPHPGQGRVCPDPAPSVHTVSSMVSVTTPQKGQSKTEDDCPQGVTSHPTRPQEGPGRDASGSTIRITVRGSGGTVCFLWFLENAGNTSRSQTGLKSARWNVRLSCGVCPGLGLVTRRLGTSQHWGAERRVDLFR